MLNCVNADAIIGKKLVYVQTCTLADRTTNSVLTTYQPMIRIKITCYMYACTYVCNTKIYMHGCMYIYMWRFVS